MITILAQTPAGPTGNEVWIVIGGIAVLASILGNLAQWQMARRKREHVLIQPQPLDVRVMEKLVSKEECQARHLESVRGIEKIERELEGLRNERVADARAAAQSRKSMYDKIGELAETINGMPDRIVAQLLNTKRLWDK